MKVCKLCGRGDNVKSIRPFEDKVIDGRAVMSCQPCRSNRFISGEGSRVEGRGMGQQTIILKNAALSEWAVPGRDPGVSHTCEGGVCTMIFECGWMKKWRSGHVKQGT